VESIEGFILVGGASSRMGSDKARLLVEGQTFVERIAEELARVARSVMLVGNYSKEPAISLPIVPDVHRQWGALGGVHAAFSACRADWALVVACDLPFVTTSLFARLASLRDDFEAVAPIQGDGRSQPLCAFYRTAPCRRAAEAMIDSGERRPIALLQSVRTRWVSFAELEDLAGAERFFDNINTPQDYARINKKGAGTEDVGIV
jgi:molybdopterin-guanine dinucleotide biosynthesis protein A